MKCVKLPPPIQAVMLCDGVDGRTLCLPGVK